MEKVSLWIRIVPKCYILCIRDRSYIDIDLVAIKFTATNTKTKMFVVYFFG